LIDRIFVEDTRLMMASHRPSDAPPEPIQPPPDANAPPAPAPGSMTTLPQSNFLVGLDWVLAFGVMALAFLLASFSVRNSDFWMHLAAGRLLSEGSYSFGKDPFSYVGEDRIWVNHAWLYDWVLYQVFSAGGGPAVVIVKAVILAIASGLLLVAKRTGQPVFASVVCVGLALVASAPRLLLQPTIGTLLCLALLMVLIVRMPRPAGSWRFPLCVAGVFGVWANLDQWFFLGPAVLLLYALGQYIRRDDGEDPITLWKALGIGVLACMLNPHHFRVWTFPPEVVDTELIRWLGKSSELFLGAFDKNALDFGGERQNPANVYSLLALVALGAAGFALNRKHASVGLGLAWLGMAALAAYHLRAVPFFAFVAAPITAINLAAAGRRLAETPMPERTVRAIHAIRSGGRAAVGIAGLIMIALTYAGWLHPWESRRQPWETERRWAWDVEPDVSMKRAAEKIREWRETGLLPAEARVINFQVDFANYLAWYAPGEKSFFDLRLKFHRPEAEDYAALQRHYSLRGARESRESSWDANAFLRKHGISYGVTAHRDWRINLSTLAVLMGEVRDPAHGTEWVLWQVEGRAVVMGWTRQRTIPSAAFDKLRFNPVQAAYGEGEQLPMPDVRPPIVAQSVWERYVAPPARSSPDGEESFVLRTYRNILAGQANDKFQTALAGMYIVAADRCMTPALTRWMRWPLEPDPNLRLDLRPPMPSEALAVSLLAVRAARRAVAQSPDHPDGYYYLAKAYPEFLDYRHTSTDIRDIVTTANFARCRSRLPDDPSLMTNPTVDVLDVCRQLIHAHAVAQPPRLDLQLEMIKLLRDYERYQVDDLEEQLDLRSGEERGRAEREVESRRKQLSDLDKEIQAREKNMESNVSAYINASASSIAALDRAAIARRFGLVREAISELRKSHEALQKQLQTEGDRKAYTPAESARHLAEHAELIELLLIDGRAEEAVQILDSIDDPNTVAAMTSDAVRSEYFFQRRTALQKLNPRQPPFSRFDADPAAHYRALRQLVSLTVGDFERAITAMKADVQVVQQDLDTFRAQTFPDKPPPATNLPGPGELQFDLFCGALFGPLAPMQSQLGGLARVVYVDRVTSLRSRVMARVQMHVRLALVYLEWGDLKGAVHHFRQVLDTPEFASPLPAQLIAKEYLSEIERGKGSRGTNP
jgi:hypothetical protein